MEIKIHRENYSGFLKQNRIRWELFAKKRIQACIFYAIAGGFYLYLASTNLKKDENYWGFTSSFGLSLILLSIIYLIHNYRSKHKFLAATKQIIEDSKKQPEGIDINFTEASITYKDFEVVSEVKWSHLTTYKFYKDHLILTARNEYFGGLIITKNEISDEQFSELLSFVTKNLTEIK